jgi:mutator protein MutT
MQVAAAIIQNSKNQILICKRGPGGSTAFLWEFPGGKREESESLEECLKRECFEELGINIFAGEIFATTTYNYPEATIDFTFFESFIIDGEPVPTVHSEIVWAKREDLKSYDFCPADIDIIERLACKN